jgi:two-component system OmpR family sensor kinase
VLTVGDLVLDPATRRVSRGDKEIDLTPKEFGLLDLFLHHPGEALSRTRILEHVWDFAYDRDSNVVDVYVRYLGRRSTGRSVGVRSRRCAASGIDSGRSPVRLPIRTRLTLVFASVSLLVLVVAGAALVIGFRAELDRTINGGLLSRLETARADPLAGIAAIPQGDDAFAQLIGPDGALESSSNLPAEPLLPLAVLASIQGGTFFDRAVRMVDDRVAARLLAVPLADGSHLVIGIDIDDQREIVARLTVFVAVGGPIVLLALSVLGWILAGAALRPVEELRSEAAAISLSEPDRRLPIPDTGDELQRLTETLNSMLDRVHGALDRERRFVDEASHELRTPLGVLKAEVDLAMKGPRSRDELEAALQSIAQETERLRRLTQDLLVLARSDRGRLPVHRADVDVSSVIERVAAEFADRSSRDGVSLRVSGSDVRARVDSDRVRQAVENLVDNALRHAGTGRSVEVRADREGNRVRVIVTDSGSGFAGDVLDRAFEPFARADGGREGDGAGLGLTIVRAVADAHGGSATARNLEGGGAAVSLELPI